MTQVGDLYQDIIKDHYKKPRGHGLREPYDVHVRHVNPTCGDEVELRVHLVDGKVADVSYEGIGCMISQASASVLYELTVGRPIDQALSTVEQFQEMVGSRGQAEPDEAILEDAVAFAGVAKFPARVKCALLAWMAFKDATAQAIAKAGGEE
ncbi:MAG TPA: SUF system NifU family Fe-S cluster assembly protein [Micromonosporaceae bacterium]